MFRYSSYSWRKGFILSATFLLVAGMISCKKKDLTLGENTIDPNSLLNSGGIDTFSLRTFTIEEDSVITDNPAFGILGSYNDPVFGEVNSEIYTQFRLSGVNPNFGDISTIIMDSVVLGLEYIGFYGKKSTQTVEVYEINDPDGLSLDSTYYSFSTLSTTGVNLVPSANENLYMDPFNTTVIGDDTVSSQLRIYIDTNLAKGLIQEADLNPATYASNEAFTSFFKGLHIKTNNGFQSSGEGGLFYFNLNDPDSKLTMYYTQDGVSKTFDLLINTQCADFNHVDIDNSMTEVENVINDTISGQSQFFAQSFGSRAVVQIPGISNLPKNAIVHKATLELPIQYQSGSTYGPGSDISVATRLKKGDSNFFSIGILGSYDATKKAFVIDLRTWVQAVLTDQVENTELILSPVLFITSGDRIIFNGPNTSNKAKPKFSLIYTEF
jgi:hypothetical protein